MPTGNTRKTKIVATIGPASDKVETLQAMMNAGTTVTRLNLSHGSYEEHRQRIQRISQTAENLATEVAIMIDTRGGIGICFQRMLPLAPLAGPEA
jgi:pyruvate kinase